MAQNQNKTRQRLADDNWWQAWWKVVAAGIVILFIGIGLLVSIYFTIRPLALIILGVSIAAATAPIVNWLAKYMPRGLGVAIVYAVILLVFIAIGALIVPRLTSELSNIVNQLPQYMASLEELAREYRLINEQQNLSQSMIELQQAGETLVNVQLTAFSAFFDMVLVLVISIYAVLAAPKAERFLLSFIPERHDDDVASVVGDMVDNAGGYVRAALLNGVIVGVVVYIGLFIIGVEYALTLAVLAGVLELIPIVGTIISTFIITVIALVQTVTIGLITFVFLLVVQQIEGNFIVPIVMHKQTDAPPLLVLLAVFIGSAVGGVVGAIASVPFTVMLVALVKRVIAPWIRRQTHAAYQSIPTPPSE